MATAPTNNFIGRDDALAAVVALLQNPACRLVTINGPGGIGKTRLAQEIAGRLDYPAHFLSLRSVQSPDQIIPAIARALNLSLTGAEHPFEQALENCPPPPALLILDNFEHLLDGVDVVLTIIQRAPSIKLLVTSRVTLNLQGEWVYTLGGLEIPDLTAQINLNTYSAPALFIERARQARQDFDAEAEAEAIIQICQLVEGNPLALELAAAWVRALTCDEIVAELQQGMDILSTQRRDIDDHHRSMRTVCESTWKLLTPDEREAFRKLSVFRGGFDRRAAQSITGASLAVLASLVDHSIITLRPNGRYEIHNLLRNYACERLAETPDEEQALYNRHALYFTDFLHQLEPRLKSSEQIEAVSEIDARMGNLMAAWEWAARHRLDSALEQAMYPLALYLQIRLESYVGEQVFRLAVGNARETVTDAKLLLLHGWFTTWTGKNDEGLGLLQTGMAILDAHRVRGELAMALSVLSWFENHPSVDFAALQTRLEGELALYEERDDLWNAAWILYGLGNIARFNGDYMRSKTLLKDSVAHFRQTGDGWSKTWPLGGLCVTLRAAGYYQEAIPLYEELIRDCAAIRDNGGITYGETGLGDVYVALGDLPQAFHHYRLALEAGFKTRDWVSLIDPIASFAHWLVHSKQDEQAFRLFSAIIQHPASHKGWANNRRLEAQGWIERLRQRLPAVPNTSSADLEGLVRSLIDQYALPSPQPVIAPVALTEPLSERELEVLRLVVQGYTNPQIAETLVLAPGTVKAHLNHIYGKLGVQTRTAASLRARELGLVEV